jgi:hypothetical protein
MISHLEPSEVSAGSCCAEVIPEAIPMALAMDCLSRRVAKTHWWFPNPETFRNGHCQGERR